MCTKWCNADNYCVLRKSLSYFDVFILLRITAIIPPMVSTELKVTYRIKQ